MISDKKLIVITPSGEQQVISVDITGSYFDKSRVLWDTSIDGQIPDSVLTAVGSLGKNTDGSINLSDNVNKLAHDSAVADVAQQAANKANRIATIKNVGAINTLPELKLVVQKLVEHLGL